MVNGLIAGLSMSIIVLVVIMSIIVNNLSYRIDQLEDEIEYIEKHYEERPEEKQINNCKNNEDKVMDVDDYLGYKDFDIDEFLKKHDPEVYYKIHHMD